MTQIDLISERDSLQRKLDWLGLRSTGSDRLEERIKEINEKLGYSHERYLKLVGGRQRRSSGLVEYLYSLKFKRPYEAYKGIKQYGKSSGNGIEK